MSAARTYDGRAIELLEAASKALAEESGMVVCWHEFRAEELLASGCPQCLVEAAINEMRSAEVVRDLDEQIALAREALRG